jgi:quercetin dioxygenase-like cupin family protein
LARLLKKASVVMTVEFCSVARVAGFAPGAREIRHTRPGLLSGYALEGKLNLEHEGRPATTKQETSSTSMQAKFMWA